MLDCPQCKLPLANNAVCCNGCGWSRPGAASAASHFLCSHEDRGQRCSAPGSFSSSTLGGGPWFCSDHFPPFRNWNSGQRTPPPATFRAIAAKLRPVAIDVEATVERLAIQGECVRVEP